MKKIHCFPVFQIPRSGTEHAPAGKIPAIRKIAALFGLDRINQTTFPAVIIIKKEEHNMKFSSKRRSGVR